jgi:hypothetical protein
LRIFRTVAFAATISAELAFAGNRLRRQRGRAFQASSPKLSSPAGDGRAFFGVLEVMMPGLPPDPQRRRAGAEPDYALNHGHGLG